MTDEQVTFSDLAKSINSFMLAASLFSLQQACNFLMPTIETDDDRKAESGSGKGRKRGQANNLMMQMFQTGADAQKSAVDLLAGVNLSQSFTPRNAAKLTLDFIRQAAAAGARLLPEVEDRLAWQELQNKLQAFTVFEYVDKILAGQSKSGLTLAQMLGKTAELDSYSRVWATEGLGFYYAERMSKEKRLPQDLLKEINTGDLPEHSLIALHAGMGLSLAERHLARLKPDGDAEEIKDALKLFIALCQRNARAGYIGATFEALGLVARNLYPQFTPIIGSELGKLKSGLENYFWHGVGRAIYFAPTNFSADSATHRRVIEMTQQEPPDEIGRKNALAGWAWAFTLVNVRQPEILANSLRHHGDLLAASRAFINGFESAVIVWNESAPGDAYLPSLFSFEPKDARAAAIWQRQIKPAGTEALQNIHPVLKERRQFSELFRYQNLLDLI